MKLQRAGASLAALVLALVAGCGSGGLATGEDAAPGAGLTRANFASTLAEAQKSARTAHVEAEIAAQGQQFTMTGDVDGSGKQVAADFSMSGAALGGSARFILLDRVMYFQVPGLTQGNKFVEFDLRDSDAPGAQMLDQMLDQLNQLDPTRNTEMFKAITNLQERGTAEVDGVEATRYTVTVDTRKALQAMGMGDMADMAAPGQMPATIKQDVWVDGDNHLRRLRMNQPNVTMDMTYSQWGEPVDISAPPAGRTTDLEQMMGQMQGGAPRPRG